MPAERKWYRGVIHHLPRFVPEKVFFDSHKEAAVL